MASVTRDQALAGLGRVICHSLARQHGGVWVSDGQGSLCEQEDEAMTANPFETPQVRNHQRDLPARGGELT